MRKILRGTIVSNKMKNTVVVNVDRLVAHAKYHKRFKVSKKYKVHAQDGDFKTGDAVIIESCRPISRDKKWRVLSKIETKKAESLSESL